MSKPTAKKSRSRDTCVRRNWCVSYEASAPSQSPWFVHYTRKYTGPRSRSVGHRLEHAEGWEVGQGSAWKFYCYQPDLWLDHNAAIHGLARYLVANTWRRAILRLQPGIVVGLPHPLLYYLYPSTCACSSPGQHFTHLKPSSLAVPPVDYT